MSASGPSTPPSGTGDVPVPERAQRVEGPSEDVSRAPRRRPALAPRRRRESAFAQSGARAERAKRVEGHPEAGATPILELTDLSLAAGRTPLVHGVSLAVAPGEAVGIVGESGSGKSLTLRAAIGLLPPGVRRTGGEVALRAHAGLVLQDPLAALDPLATVGSQLAEVCRTAGGLPRAAARDRALELLHLVGIPDPPIRARELPGALSGGQRQRVVLAIALAAEPGILLCDEPTTALDVTVQRRILDLLARLREQLGLAMLFVSHDLAVVGEVCSRIVVMHDGRVVETGPTRRILTAPEHPYTRMLLESVLPVPAPLQSGGPR